MYRIFLSLLLCSAGGLCSMHPHKNSTWFDPNHFNCCGDQKCVEGVTVPYVEILVYDPFRIVKNSDDEISRGAFLKFKRFSKPLESALGLPQGNLVFGESFLIAAEKLCLDLGIHVKAVCLMGNATITFVNSDTRARYGTKNHNVVYLPLNGIATHVFAVMLGGFNQELNDDRAFWAPLEAKFDVTTTDIQVNQFGHYNNEILKKALTIIREYNEEMKKIFLRDESAGDISYEGALIRQALRSARLAPLEELVPVLPCLDDSENCAAAARGDTPISEEIILSTYEYQEPRGGDETDSDTDSDDGGSLERSVTRDDIILQRPSGASSSSLLPFISGSRAISKDDKKKEEDQSESKTEL